MGDTDVADAVVQVGAKCVGDISVRVLSMTSSGEEKTRSQVCFHTDFLADGFGRFEVDSDEPAACTMDVCLDFGKGVVMSAEVPSEGTLDHSDRTAKSTDEA